MRLMAPLIVRGKQLIQKKAEFVSAPQKAKKSSKPMAIKSRKQWTEASF